MTPMNDEDDNPTPSQDDGVSFDRSEKSDQSYHVSARVVYLALVLLWSLVVFISTR